MVTHEADSFLEKTANYLIFISHHTIVDWDYGFTLDICVSVRPSSVRPFFVSG